MRFSVILLRAALMLSLTAAGFSASAVAQQVAEAVQRQIVNIAEVRWESGGADVARSSNRVVLQVAPAPTPGFSIAPYRLSGASDAQATPVATPLCQGNTATVPILLDAAGADAGTTPSIVPTTEIRAGEPLYFVITYAGANTDPTRINSLTGAIKSKSGDREVLTIYETGVNTGVFAGMIQTRIVPPASVRGDCWLSVAEGDTITVESLATRNGFPLLQTSVAVLVDPYGVAFDSEDGSLVDGVIVTLIDEATGQPAKVVAADGVSSYPATVVTGRAVTDGSGRVYPGIPGDYRFPLVMHGRYHIIVTPPAPYTAPSIVTPAGLASIRRADGQAMTIGDGSYGKSFTIDTPEAVRIDLPLDRPRVSATVSKVADIAVATPGDLVLYTVTIVNPDTLRAKRGLVLVDTLPGAMRLRADTVQVDGVAAPTAVSQSADGGILSVDLGTVPSQTTRIVRYALEVRPDAADGVALNRARTRDAVGTESLPAEYSVRIARDTIADRMTVIGRVTDGGCDADPLNVRGVGGVRVLLEDGSYAITDRDGRYHLQGIRPGVHVVGLGTETLPPGTRAVDCGHNTRTGGSAISRFVEGTGGSLHRADFHIAGEARIVPKSLPEKPLASDREAAGGDRDWFAGQAPGIGWLYPEVDANPRARAVRIVIKYRPGQSIALFADGKPVDPVTYEGERQNADKTIAVGLWRGVPLGETGTHFTAHVRDGTGTLVQALDRPVAFTGTAFQASLLPARSVLLADGVTRPVIALRITDRAGHPVHHGLTGEIRLPNPYLAAADVEATQARQLAGLERARPTWRVEGDDGIALVALEPTSVSGALGVVLPFSDGKVTRQERIDVWLDPGKQPWTIVGLAEGTIGYERIVKGIQPLKTKSDVLHTDARIALFARGRVSGKWLMTLAYDSAKHEDETRFGGTIDPNAYYTIYADQSERRSAAASVRKLYLKLERPQFYALFGDYDTGIEEPQLARYVRAFNGGKAEFRSARIAASMFAADTPTRHRRDEIQGNGLSGPYALGARDVQPNSETVAIEVRDRLRANRIVDRRVLTRHIDYNIDSASGTLRFREPILSRTSNLDPQFIVVDYEVNGVGGRSLNAGGRAAVTIGRLRIGATAIRDADSEGSTILGGMDARFRPTASTELRAEIAASQADGTRGAGTSFAWLVEGEQHGTAHDVLVYARQEGGGFGIGQTARSTQARRTIGIEGSARIGARIAVSGAAWHESALDSPAARIAARGLVTYRSSLADLRAGLTFASDHRGDGGIAQSTIVQLGATRRFFGNILELDGQTEFALGNAASADFPARNRLTARVQVARNVRLVGSYERARGETISADTLRLGFDVQPWAGAKLTSAIGQQRSAEYGPRAFAAYGLAQSLQLSSHWSVDGSVDGNRTLSGVDPVAIVNPAHPVASGGYLAGDGSASEDFIALTGGATYRGTAWNWTGRAEYRAGSLADRYAVTSALSRRIGEGRALGALLSVAHAADARGQASDTTTLALSWANRPAGSRWSWLDKLEARSDSVRGAVAGRAGPIGGAPLGVSGAVSSRRVVNSLSLNYTAGDRSEISVFWGSRYVSTRFGSADVSGWSNLVGIDSRFDLSDHIDIGLAATVRLGTGARTLNYSVGPSLGLRPSHNSWLLIGYNIQGFDDRDFAAAHATRAGPYIALRLKLDNTLLNELGFAR